MALSLHAYEGHCHCGAIGITFQTAQPPSQWPVRACQCSFCRQHSARTVSDPNGSLTFRLADPSALRRYRFGMRSSDFLICGNCGGYVAAVLTSDKGQFATLNVNILRPLPAVPDAEPVSYEGESVEERCARRERRWTPVTPPV